MADNEENTAAQDTAAEAQQPAGPQFALQRQSQWQPKINFDIKTKSDKVQEGVYEVVLVLTVEAQLEEQPAFVVEVQQAGIFTAADFGDEQREQLLATVCPNILFPYAREAVDNLVVKGSFPALMLSPINFDALYAQQKQAQAEQAASTEPAN